MDLGKVLSRAWQITWRWKILWVLGFLSVLARGLSAGSNSGYSGNRTDWASFQLPSAISGLLIAVVSVMARGGLIAGVQQVEDEGATGFAQAWRVGRNRFWTLFGISVLTAVPILIVVLLGVGIFVLLILGTVGVFDTSRAAGALGIAASVVCGGTLCCGAIFLAIVLEQIRVYGERAAILEGMGWIDAFKRGWQVIKDNLGPTVLLWLVFLAIGLVLGAVIFGGVVALFAPFAGILSSAQGPMWLVVPLGCGGILAVIVFALISSIVETFTSATWTLAYREFTGLKAQPAAEPAAE
jgi:hypothetical protein